MFLALKSVSQTFENIVYKTHKKNRLLFTLQSNRIVRVYPHSIWEGQMSTECTAEKGMITHSEGDSDSLRNSWELVASRKGTTM